MRQVETDDKTKHISNGMRFVLFFFLQEALYMRRSENIVIVLVQEKTRTLQVDEAHV